MHFVSATLLLWIVPPSYKCLHQSEQLSLILNSDLTPKTSCVSAALCAILTFQVTNAAVPALGERVASLSVAS